MTQKEALDILKTGRSAFVTGAAGSGKTHLLREYISWLREKGISVGVTASTGIAATHMGGYTIHSWAGIGIKDALDSADIDELLERSYLRSRFRNTKVLIIGEISMLHDFRLDFVDKILRIASNTAIPFGGIQVILSGDFFQLPPVTRREGGLNSERPPGLGHLNPGGRGEFLPTSQFSARNKSEFAYHSDAWNSLNPAICYLEEQHRQDDQDYLDILNAIRAGNVNEDMYDLLESRLNKKPAGLIEPTKLYSHNINVDAENERELSKLVGNTCTYEMHSTGSPALCESLKKSCLAPEILILKVGARVMFVKNNFEKGYANGTLGVVEDSRYEYIRVKTYSGEMIEVEPESWRIEENSVKKAEITQYPLRLAWAITVHKSQGMSLDAAEIDLSQSFEPGMGYVALSRLRTLGGLCLRGMNDMALCIHNEAQDYDARFQEASERHTREINDISRKELDRMHGEFARKTGSAKGKNKKQSTVDVTRDMIIEGLGTKEIASKRALTRETIIGHIEEIKEKDPSFSISHLRKEIPASRLKIIMAAFHKIGTQEGGKRMLTPVKNLLGSKYSFDELRFARLFL